MFFHSISGRLIPTSRIAEIRFSHQQAEERVFIADLIDSDHGVEISEGERDRLTTAPVAYVMAEAGTKLLDGTYFDDPLIEDVIAWAISPSGDPSPITGDGLDGGSVNPWVVVFPSGRVSRQGIQSWETVEHYLEYCRQGASND